jgi:hypothetical protein
MRKIIAVMILAVVAVMTLSAKSNKIKTNKIYYYTYNMGWSDKTLVAETPDNIISFEIAGHVVNYNIEKQCFEFAGTEYPLQKGHVEQNIYYEDKDGYINQFQIEYQTVRYGKKIKELRIYNNLNYYGHGHNPIPFNGWVGKTVVEFN